MTMPLQPRFFLFSCIVVLLCTAAPLPAPAQEAPGRGETYRDSIRWMNGPEAAGLAVVPSFVWLQDGRCVLYDIGRPAAERTLEVLDPASGKRLPLVDAAKALESLRGLQKDGAAQQGLPFPAEIDRAGRFALYLLRGDIFLLETGTSSFRRVTGSPEQEKCASFSPDGKSIAFVRKNNLYLYTIATGSERPLTGDGTETRLNGTLSWVYWEEVFGRHDKGYWWSEDSRAIAYLQSDESEVSLQHYVDVKPWTPQVITQRYPKIGEKNPVVRAGILELATDKTTWVDFGGHRYEYLVRVQWLPGSRRLSLQTLNRLQTELTLFFADRASGTVTPVLKETDPAWVNVLDDMVFLRDGKRFLWGSERDGYEHLYLYTMDGKLLNRVTRGNWTIRAAGGEVAWLKGGIVGVDDREERVYFTALEKSSIEKHLYSVKLDGSDFRRVSTEDGTHAVTFSHDMRFYMDRHSSIATLPSLTLRDRDGKARVVVADARPDLTTRLALRYPVFFTIPARDGFPMPAQILRPESFVPGRAYPVIFYVYSGPAAPVVSNTWQREIFWENLLLKNGYLVVRCDNRSATGISRKLEDLVLHRLSGESELNDLVDAVRWMKAQPYVDSSRVGIWGWSGGGSCTLNGMTGSAEFKAGIAVAGVTDFRFYDTKFAEQYMKTEAENREGLEGNALTGRAKNLHGRLLLVHGTYDDNVHIQNAWAFTNELIRANKQFDMMIYPMRMHGIADTPARVHLYTTMFEFWKRNL